MFFRAFVTQFFFILRQRVTQFVLYFLFLLVSFNFIRNILTFQGQDVIHMYHPMKLLLLSFNQVYYNSDMTLLLVQLYPLLLACPAGLVLAKENDMGLHVLMEARVGSMVYKFSKLAASFCATTLVFTVPFLSEILLNCLAFPIEASGDMTNWNAYNPIYIHGVNNYLFHELYIVSPYLYAIVLTIFFGCISGILGAVVTAFSAIVPVKYRLLYLLPMFILLNSTIYVLPSLLDINVESEWYHYFLLFNDHDKNIIGFVLVLILLLCFSLIATYKSGRKDCLK